MVTGFRLGLGGAQTRYGVTPDLCSTGKAISGGLPLGVLCGRADIMDLADPRRRLRMLPFTMQTGTFSSNPVSTGVACAVIADLEKGESYARMYAVGSSVMARWGLHGPSAPGLLTSKMGPAEQGQLQGAISSMVGITGMIGPGLFSIVFSTFIGNVPGAPFLLAAVLLLCGVALTVTVVPRAGLEAEGRGQLTSK